MIIVTPAVLGVVFLILCLLFAFRSVRRKVRFLLFHEKDDGNRVGNTDEDANVGGTLDIGGPTGVSGSSVGQGRRAIFDEMNRNQ